MQYEVETVADYRNVCGEAPTWDPRTRKLLWVDNESSLVYELDAATGRSQVISRNLHVGAIALTRGTAYLFGGNGGLHVWRGQDDYRTVVAADGDIPLQFNDMIAGPTGAVYGGTMYWGPSGMERYGKLYLISPSGSLQVQDDGIEVSNGLGFSPDDRTLYYADSTARQIYAYDVERTGALSNRRTLVQVTTDEGIPDGLTVDAEGFIWCAHWYGGEVVRYDPEGNVERRLKMPARQVSSVMFGGRDLTDLYVTSAANAWASTYAPPGFDPKASNIGGALYRVRLDVRGREEHRADFA